MSSQKNKYMFRLADKVMTEDVQCFPGCNTMLKHIKDNLRHNSDLTKIVADEVDLYFEKFVVPDHQKEGYAIGIKDIPNAAPPFGLFWIESTNSSKSIPQLSRYGAFCTVLDPQNAPDGDLYIKDGIQEDTKWIIACFIITEYTKSFVASHDPRMLPLFLYPLASYIYVDKNGKVQRCLNADYSKDANFNNYMNSDEITPEIADKLASELTTFALILMLGVSFLHCKNLNHEEVDPPEKFKRKMEQEKRKRKQRRSRGTLDEETLKGYRPYFVYKVLRIDPLKEELEQHRQSSGMPVALHRCRGHWRTVTKPFGKQVEIPATWFIPSHERGNPKVGRIKKDYETVVPNQKVESKNGN